MKRIPKTPIEFDYDLWTTEDGKCMVRVKLTGEVTEVDREVMKSLRAEEKKLRRSYGTVGTSNDENGEDKIRYKKDVEVPLHIAKELRECAEEAALLDYRMENIQKNLGTYLKPDTQTPEQR